MVEFLSVGSDISKVRRRLSPNFEILEKPETEKKIDDYFIKIIEEELQAQPPDNMFQDAIRRISYGLNYISLKTTLINISKRIARRPFRVNCIDLCIIEILFALENDTELALEPYLQKLFHRHFLEKLPDIYHHTFNANTFGVSLAASFLRETFAETDQADPEYPLFFTYTLRQTSVFDITKFLSCKEKYYRGDFRQFLKNILLDDDEQKLLSPRHKKACNEWLSATQNIRAKSVEFLPEKPVPDNWVIVEGKLKKEQFHQFISFLYLEKDGPNGSALLTKKETEWLVRYGFAYPKSPISKEKLTLKISKKQPKKWIYYMFYKLQEAHCPYFKPVDYKNHFALFLKNHFTNFNHLSIRSIKNEIRSYDGGCFTKKLSWQQYLPGLSSTNR